MKRKASILTPDRVRAVLSYDPETGDFRWRIRVNGHDKYLGMFKTKGEAAAAYAIAAKQYFGEFGRS